MLLFVDYIATKKIVAPALNSMAGGHSKVFVVSYGQIWDAHSCAGETRHAPLVWLVLFEVSSRLRRW